MRIRLLCLDFDGVVLESNSIRDQAWGGIFQDQPAEVRKDIIAFHRANPGIDREEKLRRINVELLHRSPSEDQITRQLTLFRDYCEAALIAAPFVPGVETLLEELDVPVIVLTAAREDEVMAVCAQRGLNRFSEIRGGPDSKIRHLERLAVEYELSASEILMVGDQLSDWRAAAQVECRFIGRIAPDRPASFGPEIVTIKDLSLGWTGLKTLLSNNDISVNGYGQVNISG